MKVPFNNGTCHPAVELLARDNREIDPLSCKPEVVRALVVNSAYLQKQKKITQLVHIILTKTVPVGLNSSGSITEFSITNGWKKK